MLGRAPLQPCQGRGRRQQRRRRALAGRARPSAPSGCCPRCQWAKSTNTCAAAAAAAAEAIRRNRSSGTEQQTSSKTTSVSRAVNGVETKGFLLHPREAALIPQALPSPAAVPYERPDIPYEPSRTRDVDAREWRYYAGDFQVAIFKWRFASDGPDCFCMVRACQPLTLPIPPTAMQRTATSGRTA